MGYDNRPTTAVEAQVFKNAGSQINKNPVLNSQRNHKTIENGQISANQFQRSWNLGSRGNGVQKPPLPGFSVDSRPALGIHKNSASFIPTS
mmetsp:Transcript_7755/g.13015  ORF Transcript_7755/g.13015 Transcript_7755/m.13015 type:complete len:91 (-) Transcript_7755:258-530(-)